MRRVICAISLALVLPLFSGEAKAEPVIFAAASTSRALDAVIAAWPGKVTASYGASGTIARQIEQGAPADLFLSANPKWMAYLTEMGLVAEGSAMPLMSNSLVLIAPKGAAELELSPDAIADRLEGELFAMADPTVAPVGNYGKAALESLGLWAVAGSVLVPTRNTISTVQAVASGETVLGLVYASDAKGVADVTVVAELPASSHPAIEYPIAALTEASDPEGAAGFLEFLGSQEAAEILAAHGFTPLGLDN